MKTLDKDLIELLSQPRRSFCHAKIHRCVVTQADLNYVGSITIDSALLKAAKILPYTKVEVVNITRADAARIMTYVIEGPANSGVVCLNGAAAHHFSPGDLAIVMSYEEIPVSLLPGQTHIAVQVNGEEGIVEGKTNQIVEIQQHIVPALEDLGQPENSRFGEVYKKAI